SVRIWRTATRAPESFLVTMSGNPIEQVSFSDDGQLLGLLSSNRVHVMDTANGDVVAQFELGERHRSIAFADATRLFVGSENGALRVISKDAVGSWSIQSIWTGDTAIRWLKVSPRSQFLVFVDQNNLARQFSLAEGRLGEASLQLPAPVEEVVFAPGGSRVLFRTPRWIHRAGSSTNGLIWLDATLAPNTLHGGEIVFGDPLTNNDAALGNRVYVLTAGDRSATLMPVDLTNQSGPGLFGNKDELLNEWRQKLGEQSIYESP
ncbi:MAG: hypothetical protein KJO82_07625, partial [Gammaproteobacteria bacterium]|nr:hypothetical protein [Gammaproteobacteria bacterium]